MRDIVIENEILENKNRELERCVKRLESEKNELEKELKESRQSRTMYGVSDMTYKGKRVEGITMCREYLVLYLEDGSQVRILV